MSVLLEVKMLKIKKHIFSLIFICNFAIFEVMERCGRECQVTGVDVIRSMEYAFGNKIFYKKAKGIFNTNCFLTKTGRRKNLSFRFKSTFPILFIVLVKYWTNTPLPAARVNSWVYCVRTIANSGKKDSEIWIY